VVGERAAGASGKAAAAGGAPPPLAAAAGLPSGARSLTSTPNAALGRPFPC
jgi:hypothetical protein